MGIFSGMKAGYNYLRPKKSSSDYIKQAYKSSSQVNKYVNNALDAMITIQEKFLDIQNAVINDIAESAQVLNKLGEAFATGGLKAVKEVYNNQKFFKATAKAILGTKSPLEESQKVVETKSEKVLDVTSTEEVNKDTSFYSLFKLATKNIAYAGYNAIKCGVDVAKGLVVSAYEGVDCVAEDINWVINDLPNQILPDDLFSNIDLSDTKIGGHVIEHYEA